MTTMKSFSELSMIDTFEDRLSYLRLRGGVGRETFGFDRYINQAFYHSREWKQARIEVINRDKGLDLGVEGYEIFERPIIHHMNPIGVSEIENALELILNPEYLITTCHQTHNAIHYGADNTARIVKPVRRVPGDTKLW